MAAVSRIARTAASGILAAALSLAAVQPVVAAPDEPKEHVGLGDSFSAGSGVWPMVPGTSPVCWQSERNFAHLVAAERGHRLTDVSCGGAKTSDFYTPQYPGLRPQLDALTPSTDLVTITIGGNDSSTFAGAMAKCISAGATRPGIWDPCRQQYGDSLARPILDTTHPALVRALHDIRARSPRAEVVIVGYPWLLPPTGGCPATMPLAPGDVPYLRELQTTLNGTVRRAATETGATFVDMSVRSEGRDGCQSPDVRWIEPLLGTDQLVPVHPNAAGERAIADAVLDVLDRT